MKKFLFKMFARGRVNRGVYKSWSGIRNVLLLFESDFQEKNKEIKEIIKRLNAEGKKVYACGYVGKKKAETAELDNYVILDKSSYTFFCRPKGDIISRLRKEKFDVIIDLSGDNNYELKYLLLGIDSGMRCGGQTEERYYDLMIDLPEPDRKGSGKMVDLRYSRERELYDQIEKYLKMINSK